VTIRQFQFYPAYLAGKADLAHPVLLCLEQEKNILFCPKKNKDRQDRLAPAR
jgi:hypothetical protein